MDDDDEGASCLEENSAKSSNSWRSTLFLEEKTAIFSNRSSFGRAGAAVERKGVGSGGGVNVADGVVKKKQSRQNCYV